MGHLYHGYVSHNQRVIIKTLIDISFLLAKKTMISSIWSQISGHIACQARFLKQTKHGKTWVVFI